MQKLELEKHNLLNPRKEGFPMIDLFSYQYWDNLPEKEKHAHGFYGENEQVFNPNSLIFVHMPTDRKVYPSGASIWRSREAAFADRPFFIPLNLQQMVGLLCTFNIILPWDHSKSGVNF